MPPPAPPEISRVRILVVGESGTGKTSFLHLLCSGRSIANPAGTVGASVELKLHEFHAGMPTEQLYFLEFWDIGGSRSHANSRRLFYSGGVHGIILVHDLTNSKTAENLRAWVAEIFDLSATPARTTRAASPVSFTTVSLDESAISSSPTVDPASMPILVVGTKLDASPWRETSSGISPIAQRFGADEVVLDCRQPKYLAPGTTNALKLTKFFDRVIERQFSKSTNERYFAAGGERRRALFKT